MKKLLILNGMKKEEKSAEFEEAVEKNVLESQSLEIEYFRLRDMDVRYCTGCWNCWLKTPGKCSIKDDFEQILSRIPHADHILYISQISAGSETSILKKSLDRSIPNVHPYIRLLHGETHHRMRYPKLPHIHILLKDDGSSSDEEIGNIKRTYERRALNFDSSVLTFQVTDKVQEVENVFSGI